MNSKIRNQKRLLLCGSILNLLLNSNIAQASGLHVPFTNASDTGEARSGAAVIAEDASTNYSNSAGLTFLNKEQFIVTGIALFSHAVYRGTMFNPGLPVTTGGVTTFPGAVTESGKMSTSPHAIIPSLHFSKPINQKFAFGFSIVAPTGVGLDYNNTSMARYDLIYESQTTIDFSPSLAFQATPKLSIAGGPDAVYFAAKLKVAARLQPYTTSDAYQVDQGSGWKAAWHAGILYVFNPENRIGLAYHSSVINHAYGSSHLYIPTGGTLTPGVVRTNNLEAVLPSASLTTLSFFHQTKCKLGLMGTVEFADWSIYRNDRLYNAAGPTGPISLTNPRNFHNTWLFALGARYQIAEKWLLRGGANYEQGAAHSNVRDLLIDPDHIQAAIGAHYQMNKKIGFDMVYGHNFYQNASTNHVSGGSGNTLHGTSISDLNFFGAQLVWSI